MFRFRLFSVGKLIFLGLALTVSFGLLQTVEAASKQRRFYLTTQAYDGAEALPACAPGFHMASLWEIFDVTSLRYDTNLGFTTADSGFGPPVAVGWIRTGSLASGVPLAGVGNCMAWSSNLSDSSGTVLNLNILWSDPADNSIHPWVANTDPCNTTLGVWCVQD